VLGREKASAASIVSETVFLRDLRADLGQVRAARRQALGLRDALPPRAATTEIEQPPLDEGARLDVSLQAILPIASPLRTDRLEVPPACRCAECAGSHGLRVPVGDEIRLYAAGLNGAGTSAHEQSLGMFSLAEELLQRAGMDFGDVIRTWIHLRDIDRDYADLNRARRSFFEARGIDPPPASTGIGGGPAAPEHDLCLGLYAVRSARSADREVMTTPTLNEATSYGSDFVRGMRRTSRDRPSACS
jgi:enamine deaminase RidA (YjgF/YER057c/UK114 family)